MPAVREPTATGPPETICKGVNAIRGFILGPREYMTPNLEAMLSPCCKAVQFRKSKCVSLTLGPCICCGWAAGVPEFSMNRLSDGFLTSNAAARETTK